MGHKSFELVKVPVMALIGSWCGTLYCGFSVGAVIVVDPSPHTVVI
jgi:hypothetical protein